MGYRPSTVQARLRRVRKSSLVHTYIARCAVVTSDRISRVLPCSYLHNRLGHTHLFVQVGGLDGEGHGVVTQITSGNFDESSAVWSPDGKTIAFGAIVLLRLHVFGNAAVAIELCAAAATAVVV
eukprot:SAG11_NODE_341_length_10462_cov_49.272990_10_plen_124_part_00